MPTYVYECSKCEQTFEAEQRISEDPLTDCRCGSVGTVKRIIQPIAVMFKGGGFHINDYSPAAAPTASEPAAAPAAECTGTPSTCACSAPEASSE